MAERNDRFPDADRQEQLVPAGSEDDGDPVGHIRVGVEAPEADVLEQATPAGAQPGIQVPAHSRTRPELIPEADAMEQALPADRELFEDGE
ncbi:MAG TPA: hypothetical protein VK009_28310 [Chloroflexota bacterium]|nr:hypothetical protein [Chloroflexota bacterium]